MKKNEYDAQGIIEYIKSKPEIDPYLYDGCYELIQEIVRAYSKMDNLDNIDYHDMDCIYLSVIISSSCGINSKKNSIKNSHLSDVDKERLLDLADVIWEKTINNKYLHDDDGAEILGMFGSGFMTFKRTTSDEDAIRFVQMCVDIINKTDEQTIFNIVESVFNDGIRGLKAASASVMLHCLKPTVFPILNGNMGTDNIFEAIGIKLKKRTELITYIGNCRKIKIYRDENFAFKNYRVIDLCQRDISKFIVNSITNRINTELLKREIDLYKKDFQRIISEENYKWEAVKCFQENFNIDANDFPNMLEKSISKSNNLLTRVNFFPAGVIKEISRFDPEYCRDMFKKLFDESVPILDRINQFTDDSEIYYQFKEDDKLNTYQDAPAISVYLFLRYPDKYYIYMSNKFKTVAEVLEYGDIPKRGTLERVASYFDMVDQIWEYTKTDKELINLNRSRINDKCYTDSNNHILAEDIVYFISRRNNNLKNLNDSGFWPSYDEYPIDITKNDWIRFIKDIEYPNHKGCIRVLKCYLETGGVSSPKNMSELYGGHSMVYTSSIANTSRRALKYFDIQPCVDEDNTPWLFPIAFLGKEGEGNDKGTFVYKMRTELMDALREIDIDDIDLRYKNRKEEMENSIYNKNTILYGPPGTGKTYSSILYAVGICENKQIEELKYEDYGEVFERFKAYRENGRISFTTFHQSYGYEEFIEGIRPVIDESDEDNSDIRYTIEDGIFKKFCNQAMLPSDVSDSVSKYGLNKNPTVWKVSLETTGDNPTRTECLENGHIRIGWDQYGKVVTDDIDFSEYGGKTVLNSFMNKMQVGDVVLSCYSASTIDAIGVVTGDYEWHPEYDKYKRLRKVNWISKDINYNILDLNGGTSMTLSTVYKLKMSVSDVFKILDEVGVSDKTLNDSSSQNYVFIIDEINRGNISKIFGELITLIEETKRLGCSEAAEAILPYSHTSFGIPKNVYILGTMNTADRSIALMDTALRRRFSFEEMMPDSNVLRDMGINTITSDGQTIDVADMLDIINERIEYLYDREHTIGHAFFTVLADNPSIDKLAEIFENKVIPLLQEYFYEDYGKIQLVLGDNGKKEDEFKFILDKSIKTKDVFQGDTSELDLPEKKYIIQKSAFNKIQSYKMIADNL